MRLTPNHTHTHTQVKLFNFRLQRFLFMCMCMCKHAPDVLNSYKHNCPSMKAEEIANSSKI